MDETAKIIERDVRLQMLTFAHGLTPGAASGDAKRDLTYLLNKAEILTRFVMDGPAAETGTK